MASKHAHRTLPTRHHRLADGRLVAVRRAVPSDAPELTALDADVDCVGGLVALDDHGAIVAHAGVGSGVAALDGWSESELAALFGEV